MDPIFLASQSAANYSVDSTLTGFNETTQKLPNLDAIEGAWQTFLVWLYSITSIISFTSNGTVILVLLLGKKSSPELRKFLINLAIADMCMALFSMPFTYTDFMYGQWIFPEFVCPVAQFITICALSVSVHTLCAIGIER